MMNDIHSLAIDRINYQLHNSRMTVMNRKWKYFPEYLDWIDKSVHFKLADFISFNANKRYIAVNEIFSKSEMLFNIV